jgi:negative regulator of genetic competence, sporulation and motility
MAEDESDDLYDEEFDFVDDDDEESDDDGEAAADGQTGDDRERDERDGDADRVADDEPEDEYGRTAPKPDYVVHIYEYSRFKRTIDRPFTPEDAEAFATEYNRTGKSYGRVAVTSKNDAKPKKRLDPVAEE